MKALPQDFAVHEGTLRGSLPLTFTAPPGRGDVIVEVSVSYQACSDSSTLPAASIRFELLVRERPLVGRALPSETKT